MANTNPKYIYEVLQLVSKATTKQARVDILKNNETWALKDILRGTFDDSIVWLLPDGNPPYTPAQVPTNLLKQHTQFKYFAKGGPGEKLPKYKREMMFIRLLESIHPEDAKVVLAMVVKQSPVKGLTKPLVKEVFPGLIVK